MALPLLAALLVAGCVFGQQIGPERVPTVIGIVRERAVEPSRDLVVTLTDGEQVVLPVESERLPAGATAAPGELLLADPTAAEPWFVSLVADDGCFLFVTDLYEERGRTLVTQEGLVLPMRDDFVGPPTGDDRRFDPDRGAGICVDETGRAFSAGP